MGFSCKKSFTYLESSEEKRIDYQELLKYISYKDIVYIDESGIDMTICKDRGWGKKACRSLEKKAENITRERIVVLAL